MFNTSLFSKRSLAKFYDAATAKIYRELQAARQQNNYATLANQKVLCKSIQSILDEFKSDAGELFKESAHSLMDETFKRIVMEAGALGVAIEKDSIDGNESIVEQIAEDFEESVMLQTKRMMQSVRKVLRRDMFTVMQTVFVRDVSRKVAQQISLPAMLDNIPNYLFIDRAGKRWKSDFYLDTLLMVAISDVELGIAMNVVVRSGNDLLKITREGKEDLIVSIAGEVEGYPALNDVLDIFHPRNTAVPHFWRE